MRPVLLLVVAVLVSTPSLARADAPPSSPAGAASAPSSPPSDDVSGRTKITRILWTLTVGAMLGSAAGVLSGLVVGGGIPFLLNAAGNDVAFSSVAGIIGLVLFGVGVLLGALAWPLLIAAVIVGWNVDEGPPGYQRG